MSKNRLRGITLVRGPIWGIHSLTLIISWLDTVTDFFLVYERINDLKAEIFKYKLSEKQKTSLRP